MGTKLLYLSLSGSTTQNREFFTKIEQKPIKRSVIRSYTISTTIFDIFRCSRRSVCYASLDIVHRFFSRFPHLSSPFAPLFLILLYFSSVSSLCFFFPFIYIIIIPQRMSTLNTNKSHTHTILQASYGGANMACVVIYSNFSSTFSFDLSFHSVLPLPPIHFFTAN